MSKKGIGIQLDANCGLMISNGSLQIGSTLYQNQFLILKAQKGELKEYPTLGCGIDDITNDEDLDAWQKSIREEMAKDGMQVSEFGINSNGMTLVADYK